MKLFRGLGASKEPLAVSMAGVKLGDRVLVVGCGDPPLVAGVAGKSGLTGRACALDDQESRVSAAVAHALSEGALVQGVTAPWTAFPLDAGEFDVAIIRGVLPAIAPDVRGGCIAEVHRVLRPGGRCMVIDGRTRTGLAALVSRAPIEDSSPPTTARALESQGFRAVRTLAERDGLTFIEGVTINARR